jgi:hypothetical protein
MKDGYDWEANIGMNEGQRKGEFAEKTLSQCRCPPQIHMT